MMSRLRRRWRIRRRAAQLGSEHMDESGYRLGPGNAAVYRAMAEQEEAVRARPAPRHRR